MTRDTEYLCECETRCMEDMSRCCVCFGRIEYETDDYTETILADTGRRPCIECRQVTRHKMDCSKGR